MAPDCSGNTTGPAFQATQEFLITYCLTFVCFILFVVPFEVHFVDISWKLLQLHIFTGIFVQTFHVWNIIIGLYWQPMKLDIFRHPCHKHRRISMQRTNNDHYPYHHRKMNIWKRLNQDKC